MTTTTERERENTVAVVVVIDIANTDAFDFVTLSVNQCSVHLPEAIWPGCHWESHYTLFVAGTRPISHRVGRSVRQSVALSLSLFLHLWAS